VYATFARMEAERAGTRASQPPADTTKTKRPEAAAPATVSSDIFDQSEVELRDDDGVVADDAEAQAEAEQPVMPAPRTEGTNKVTFGFTPRIFPTPARESKAAEENDWISKNRAHLRKNKALVGRLDALDFGETDPAWLKSKGDEFYRGGDFRSAISAYTSALELDPEFIPCLSNRAACYLRVAELRECIHDCTTALNLRDSQDAPNIDTATEIKLLVRRGTAFCQQGSFEASLTDYRAATVLGSDPALIADVERLSSLAECDTLKKQADARFGVGNIAEAVELYTTALSLEPAFVSCISNRAVRLACVGLDDVKACSDAVPPTGVPFCARGHAVCNSRLYRRPGPPLDGCLAVDRARGKGRGALWACTPRGLGYATPVGAEDASEARRRPCAPWRSRRGNHRLRNCACDRHCQ